jgi:hypothetical protein
LRLTPASPLPDQLHFHLQPDAGLGVDRFLHLPDEGVVVAGGATAGVDEEVAMHWGDLRPDPFTCNVGVAFRGRLAVVDDSIEVFVPRLTGSLKGELFGFGHQYPGRCPRGTSFDCIPRP